MRDPETQRILPRRFGDRAAGIALMLGAVACFAALDASTKWVNLAANPLQTATFRYLASLVIVTVATRPWSRPVLYTRSLGLQCTRAVLLVIATVSSFFAGHYLPLAQAAALSFAAPLIVTVLAGPLLGERIGRLRAAAVAVGFVGVLVVTRPFGGAIQPAVLLVGVVAVVNALYSMTTRKLAGRDSSLTTLFYTGLVGSLVLAPGLPFIWVAPPTALSWVLMAATGVFGALGHWLLILAHGRAPASVLAPFFYTQLIWAASLGFLVFQDVPDRWTMAGGAIIMASGLYLFLSDRGR